MKINEKRVACPPKAAKLEIHFEGNLICCKRAKNILQSAEEPHGVSVCFVCVWACVCGRWGRHALNSSAERRETLESVNNSANSALFLHDCSPALHVWIQLQDGQNNLSKVTWNKKSLACSLQVFICLRLLYVDVYVHRNQVTWNTPFTVCLVQCTAQFGLYMKTTVREINNQLPKITTNNQKRLKSPSQCLIY